MIILIIDIITVLTHYPHR